MNRSGDIPLADEPHGAEVEPGGLPNGKGLVVKHPPPGYRHHSHAARHLAEKAWKGRLLVNWTGMKEQELRPMLGALASAQSELDSLADSERTLRQHTRTQRYILTAVAILLVALIVLLAATVLGH